MRGRGITYFENSRRATLAQRSYCIANPGRLGRLLGQPVGPHRLGRPFGYAAHGAPPAENDNGTITPTAGISSLPFAPEVVLPLSETCGTTGGRRCGARTASPMRSIHLSAGSGRTCWASTRADRAHDRELPERGRVAAHEPRRGPRPRPRPGRLPAHHHGRRSFAGWRDGPARPASSRTRCARAPRSATTCRPPGASRSS